MTLGVVLPGLVPALLDPRAVLLGSICPTLALRYATTLRHVYEKRT
jgi:hypothetical protein